MNAVMMQNVTSSIYKIKLVKNCNFFSANLMQQILTNKDLPIYCLKLFFFYKTADLRVLDPLNLVDLPK
jgi:hypothetical protein